MTGQHEHLRGARWRDKMVCLLSAAAPLTMPSAVMISASAAGYPSPRTHPVSERLCTQQQSCATDASMHQQWKRMFAARVSSNARCRHAGWTNMTGRYVPYIRNLHRLYCGGHASEDRRQRELTN